MINLKGYRAQCPITYALVVQIIINIIPQFEFLKAMNKAAREKIRKNYIKEGKGETRHFSIGGEFYDERPNRGINIYRDFFEKVTNDIYYSKQLN